MNLFLSKSELFFLCQLIMNYEQGQLPKLKSFVQLSDSDIDSLHRLLWSSYDTN